RDWSVNSFGALAPTTTRGIFVTASSTIGNGAQTGGLTINGGATTTGNAYFGGNVGIGTTSPSQKLDVNGSIALSGILIHRSTGDLDTTGFAYTSWQDSSTGSLLERGWVGYGVGDSGVDLSNSAGAVYLRPGGSRTLTALTNGNIGIGTTTPQNALSVAGTVQATSALTVDAMTAGSSNASLFLNGYLSGVKKQAQIFANFNGGLVMLPNATDPTVTIGASSPNNGNTLGVSGKAAIGSTFYNAAAPTNGLIVEGSVGLGTSSPTMTGIPLTTDSGTSNYDIVVNSTSARGAGLAFRQNGIDKGFIGSEGKWIPTASPANMAIAGGAGYGLSFFVNGAASPSAVLTSVGNLGIGTTTPNAPLQVAGRINSITSVARGTNVEFVGADASNLAAFPRAFFYGHSGSAISNFGLYTASGDATGVTQTPAFIGVSTNADVKQASSKQLALLVDTTAASIFTLSGENGGANGAVDLYLGGGSAKAASAMVVKTTGEVGIGTTSPFARLSLGGSAYIGGNLTATGTLTLAPLATAAGSFLAVDPSGAVIATGTAGLSGTFFQQNGNSFGATAVLGTNDAQSLQLETNNSPKVTVTSTGNIGVGSTTPTAKLTVTNGGSSTGITNVLSGAGIFTNGGGGNLGLALGHDATANRPFIQSVSDTTAFSMSINPYGGNVGIGTTSPFAQLSVSNSTSAGVGAFVNAGYFDRNVDQNYALTVRNTNPNGTANNTFAGFSAQAFDFISNRLETALFGLRSKTNSAANGETLISAPANIDFYVNHAGTSIDTAANYGSLAATILANGNFGIGTSSPNTKLQVRAGTDMNFKVDTAFNLAGAVVIKATNDADTALTAMEIRTSALIAGMTGNVGIGTTTPAAKLDIFGGSAAIESGANFDTLRLGTQSAGNGSLVESLNAARTNYAPFQFFGTSFAYTNGSATRNDLTINSAGNVGLGTTSPQTKLEVSSAVSGSGADGPAIRITNGAHGGPSGNGNLVGSLDFYSLDPQVTGLKAQIRAVGDATSNWGPGGNSATNLFLAGSLSGTQATGVTINYAGNVGVGTTTPLTKLGVKGNAIFYGDGTTEDPQPDSAGLRVGYNTGGDYGFVNAVQSGTASKTLVLNRNGGNVTVGTTSALSKLVVSAGGAGNGGTLSFVDFPLQYNDVIRVNSTGGSLTGWKIRSAGGVQEMFDLTDSSNNSRFFVNTNTGNAGIGTSTPQAQLQVYGAGQLTSALTDAGAQTGAINITGASNSAGAGGAVLFSAINDSGTNKPQAAIKGLLENGNGNGRGALAFSTRVNTGDTALTEQARFTSGGNFGIGTSSPYTRFDVVNGTNELVFNDTLNSSANYLTVKASSGSNGQAGVNLRIDTTNLWQLLTDNNASNQNAFFIQNGNNPATRYFTVSTNGNVGIGTTTPYAALSISRNLANGTLNVLESISGETMSTAVSGSAIVTRYGNNSSNFGAIGGYSNGAPGIGLWGSSVSGAPSAYLASTGNLGIGTTTPATRLDVSTNDTTSTEVLRLETNGTQGRPYIGFSANAAGSLGKIGYLSTNSARLSVMNAADDYVFIGRNNTNDITIAQSTGNVGIGTTTPVSGLQVVTAMPSSPSAPGVHMGGSGSFSGMQLYGSAGGFIDFSDSVEDFDYRIIETGGRFDISTASLNPAISIVSNGNLGIGTTTPQDKLHVGNGGVIRLSTSGDTTSGCFRQSGATLQYSNDCVSYQSFSAASAGGWTDDGAVVRLTASADNVGIGTTTTTAKLTVTDNSDHQIDVYGADGSASGAGIDLISRSVAGRDFLLYSTGSGSCPGAGYFGIYDRTSGAGCNGGYRFVISPTGNVGIGTSSPRSKLEVNSTSGGATLILGSSDLGSDSQTLEFRSSFPALLNSSDIVSSIAGAPDQTTGGRIVFNTAQLASGALNERMRIDAGGAVMIGTTSPSGSFNTSLTLQVSQVGDGVSVIGNTTGSVSPQLSLYDVKTQKAVLGLALLATHYSSISVPNDVVLRASGSSSGGNLILATQNATGSLKFSTGSGGNDSLKAIITNAGNLGIGTTTPQNLLDIYAAMGTPAIRLEAAASGNHTFTINGSIPGVSNTGFAIRDESVSGGTARLVIDGSGNVGIGSTTPMGNLVVTNSGASAASIYIGDFNNSIAKNNSLKIDTAGGNNTAKVEFYEAGSPLGVATPNAAIGVLTSQGAQLIFETNGSEKMRLNSAGNLGIGTTTPLSTLTVSGSACFSKGAGVATLACGTTTGNLYYTAANTGNYDVAENYAAEDISIEAGDIVSLDPINPLKLVKAVQGGSGIFGAVSTDPGMTLGGADPAMVGASTTRPVALSGRVPVKINGEAGAIAIGDRIAVSSEPGIGKKAVGSEESVGTALESWSGGPSDHGTINVFVTAKQHVNQDQFSIDASGNIGIGTTSPTYKLQVMGDIAATSFVNISTRDAKKGIEYLDDAAKLSMLAKLRTLGVATYRYNQESDSAPLRLGLIAEEAPAEVLAAGGKGVDVYKLSTFILAGVQEMANRMDDIDTRVNANTANIAQLQSDVTAANNAIADLAARIASATTGTTSQAIAWSSGAGTAMTSFEESLVSFLSNAGLKLQNGIAYIANAVVETFTANIAYIKDATIDSASVGALTVGSAEKRSGITLYDQLTGDPYCLQIAGGQTRTQPGECPLITASSTPPVEAPAPGVSGSLVPSGSDAGSGEPQAVQPSSVNEGTTTVSTPPMTETATSTPDEPSVNDATSTPDQSVPVVTAADSGDDADNTASSTTP
ncbi:MAG TPA: hypothetical protein VHE10_00005, partial [Candidatus Paceibacterota bacterium]|nr:hypothetical protein [Candidatus Paceibacterota bacterium]